MQPQVILWSLLLIVFSATTLQVCEYRRVHKFSPYGSVCCACAERPDLPRACHFSKLACLALQVVLSAHVALAPRARLRQSSSRTLRSQKHNIFSMGPKLRYPPIPIVRDGDVFVRMLTCVCKRSNAWLAVHLSLACLARLQQARMPRPFRAR
jgi:hypothetical protein